MVEAVLKERFDFLELGEVDRARLRRLKPLVAQALPGILDRFYGDIAKHPEVDEMFKSAEMRKHAREKQLEHWLRICEAKFDKEYLDSVARIGKAHARLGLKPNWYFGGYSKIAGGLMKAVTRQALSGAGMFKRTDSTELEADVDALTKAAMLDMDLCMSEIEARAAKAKAEERMKLANDFEETVASIVSSVAAASEQLAQTARTMSSTAETTSEKSSTVAAAAEEAGSIEGEAVSEVLGGLTFEALRGDLTIRECDHMANVGEYVGVTTQDSEYGIPIMTDVTFVPAEDVWDSCEDIELMRAEME